MDRRPGRPRALTIEAIVDAAIEDGLATFSMPSVAARLGVAHSGLYRYVRDRDELLVLAIERAALSVDWPEPDLPWRDLMRAITETIWAICDRYPGYDVVALSPPRWPQRVIEQAAPYIGSLHAQGFTIEDASVAIEVSGSLALTTSVLKAGHATMATPDGRPNAARHAWHDRAFEMVLGGLESRRIA